MKIELIGKEKVESIWPQIEEWVKNALGNDRSWSSEDIKTACVQGKFELRLTYTDELKGFLISMIYEAPQCKMAYAPWLGGKDLESWVGEAFVEFREYLKSQGVKQYSFIGRKAWKRLIKTDYDAAFYLVSLI